MHPSAKDWNKFLFTLGDWLLPRSPNTALIEIFQPIPRFANDLWTDSLKRSLEWLERGEEKRILDIDPKLLQRRGKKTKPAK